MILLPTFPDVSADYEYDISLGGQSVNLRMTWNSRSEYWYMILDVNGVPYGSFKITPNWCVLRQFKALVNFEGDFLVLKDDSTAPEELTYDSFGTSWGLYYLTPDEVLNWEITNGIR